MHGCLCMNSVWAYQIGGEGLMAHIPVHNPYRVPLDTASELLPAILMTRTIHGLRPAGNAIALSKRLLPFYRTEGRSSSLPTPPNKKAPDWGPFYLAEREGFEPSMELLTPYSLSRGAPSASRPSLQVIVYPELVGLLRAPGMRSGLYRFLFIQTKKLCRP